MNIPLQFHHIGVATNCIEKTRDQYILLGYSSNEIVIDTVQNVKLCFLKKEGHPVIELIEAVDEKSPVNQIVSKVGVTPYHICYSSKDIQKSIEILKKIKFVLLKQPCVASGMNNNLICFMYHKDLGLIEIVEEK
ncbi:MAG: VOC family protein [Bacteroidia bacterium]|nr:VOC family protein [Bacteroidia bacterium]